MISGVIALNQSEKYCSRTECGNPSETCNGMFTCGLGVLESPFMKVVSPNRELQVVFGDSGNIGYFDQINEHLAVLKLQEQKRIMYRGGFCKRKKNRADTVKFMVDVAVQENLSKATLHLSVYIFDRIRDSHNIEKEYFGLTAICSLLIAAKMEESRSKVPRIHNLLWHIPSRMDKRKKNAVQLERYIIQYFGWSFMLPTAFKFLEIFAMFALDTGEEPTFHYVYDRLAPFRPPLPDLFYSSRNLTTVKDFAFEILDILLQEEPNELFPPSLVAAAVVMFARITYGFYKWTKKLELVTSYSEIQALSCCDNYVDQVYKAKRNTKRK